MTAYDNHDEAIFVAGLMAGTDMPSPLQRDLNLTRYEQLFDETQHLYRVTARLRAQVKSIAKACRQWTLYHRNVHTAAEQRYSAYEGMLCYQDLRQHWTLYRRAMREFHRSRWQAHHHYAAAHISRHTAAIPLFQRKAA